MRATCGRTLRRAGAILLVSVPATIITSLCRGDGRKMMPKRSRSYRAARKSCNVGAVGSLSATSVLCCHHPAVVEA